MSLDRWLIPSHDEEGKQRLKIMGNIVVPMQAAAGFAVLARVASLNT